MAFTFYVLHIIAIKHSLSFLIVFTTCYQRAYRPRQGCFWSWLLARRHAVAVGELQNSVCTGLARPRLWAGAYQWKQQFVPSHFLPLIIRFQGNGNTHWPTYLLKEINYSIVKSFSDPEVSFTAYSKRSQHTRIIQTCCCEK